MTPWIVVHGSVLGDERSPRDIDFIFCGLSPAEAERLMREAFPQYANLSLDGREQCTENVCCLPAPCGRKGPYRILLGSPRIQWQDYGGIASIVRAYGEDAVTAVAAMEQVGSAGFGRLELALFPVSGTTPRAWESWDGYTQGIPALRSARFHAPAWNEVVRLLPFGKLLDRLCKEDPRPVDAEFLNELLRGSPFASGAMELLFRFHARWFGARWSVGTEYGSEYWGFEELEMLLYPTGA